MIVIYAHAATAERSLGQNQPGVSLMPSYHAPLNSQHHPYATLVLK